MSWDRNYSRFEIQDSLDTEIQRLLSAATLSQSLRRNEVISSILELSKQLQFYNYSGETDGNLRRFFSSSLPLVLEHIQGPSIKNSIQDLRECGILIERQRLRGNDLSRKLKNDLTQLISLQIDNLELLKNAAFSEQKLIEDLLPSFSNIAQHYLKFFNNCVSDGLIALNRKIKQQFYSILPAPVFNVQASEEHWTVQLTQYTQLIDEIDIFWNSIQYESQNLLNNIIESQSIDPLSSISMILGDLLEELNQKNANVINKSIEDHFFNDIVKVPTLSPENEILYASYTGIPNELIKSIPQGTIFQVQTNKEEENSKLELTCADITPINFQTVLKKQIVCFSEKEQDSSITENSIIIKSLVPTRYQLEKIKSESQFSLSPFYFSIFSPLLSLDGNVVKWKITNSFSNVDILNVFNHSFYTNPDAKRSYDAFSTEEILTQWIDGGVALFYNTLEGEITIDPQRIFCSVQKTDTQDFELSWTVLLDVDDPQPAANEEGKIEVKFKIFEDFLFLYSIFNKLIPRKLIIESSVLDVTNLELYNDFGKLDTATPFNPFGSRPEIGSKFYIGHPLLFSNALKNLKINWQWYGLPDTTGGFSEYYRNYDLIESNEDFMVSISSLQGGTWYPESDKQILSLFTDVQSNDTESSAISNIRRMNEINLNHLNLEKTHRTYEVLKEPSKSKYGYLAFELFSPAGAFGHSRYNDLVQRNINSKKPATVLEPYTPLVTGISVEAVMYECIEGNAIGERLLSFGVEEYIMNQGPLKSQSLLPNTQYHSAMYLEFSEFQDNKAHLYFALPEKFNGLASTSEKSWHQWNQTRWNALSADNVVRDETLAFECSGQILLQDLTQGEPYIDNWLKVTSKSDDVLTRISEVNTQVIKLNIEVKEYPSEDLSIEGIIIPDSLTEAMAEMIPLHQQVIRPLPNFGFKNGPLSFQFKTENRIADLQDLKQFLLLKFPKIQEVLIISHKDNHDANIPGLVRTILIPKAKNDSLSISNWPKFSTLELNQIKNYLENHSVVGCKYSVENPIYEEIVLKGNIVIQNGMDKGEATNSINQAVLKGFLDFTGIEKKGFTFGKSIYTSKILTIIKNLPFIKSVTNFACYTKFENELLLPDNFNSLNYRVEPSNINHLLIPSSTHFLDVKENAKSLGDGIGVSNMALETDFVIDKSRYLQKNLGIGSRKLGINLKINGDFDKENHAITELFL